MKPRYTMVIRRVRNAGWKKKNQKQLGVCNIEAGTHRPWVLFYAGHWRAAVFILLAASGLAPMCHISLLDGVTALEKFPLQSLCLTCMSYALGTIVYISRFPERFWLEKFDLLGTSHQIFHVLVAAGQLVHLYGLRDSLIQCYLDEVLRNAVSGM